MPATKPATQQPRKPGYRTVVKMLAAEVHDAEKNVVRCAVDYADTLPTDNAELIDAVIDYRQAYDRLARATTPQ